MMNSEGAPPGTEVTQPDTVSAGFRDGDRVLEGDSGRARHPGEERMDLVYSGMEIVSRR